MRYKFQSAARLRAAALAACALFASTALANSELVKASDDTILTNRTDGPYTVGFDFTVDAERIINALGVEDSLDDGLEIDTEVGLWDITEVPSVQIASVLVPAGTTGTLKNGFRYSMTDSEITLEVGHTYRIGAVVGGGLAFTDTFDAGGGGEGFSGEGLTIETNRFAVGGTLAEPINDGTGDLGRWAAGNATFLDDTASGDGDLRITDLSLNPDTGTMTLTWVSKPGETYKIEFSENLEGWPGIFAPSVSASGEGQTSFTAERPGLALLFFRVLEIE